MNWPGRICCSSRASGGTSRTGLEPRARSELIRGSASSARTCSYRLSSQPWLPSGKASRATGSSSWSRRYSAGGSKGHSRTVGNRSSASPLPAVGSRCRGIDAVGNEPADLSTLATTSHCETGRQGLAAQSRQGAASRHRDKPGSAACTTGPSAPIRWPGGAVGAGTHGADRDAGRPSRKRRARTRPPTSSDGGFLRHPRVPSHGGRARRVGRTGVGRHRFHSRRISMHLSRLLRHGNPRHSR